MEKTNNFMSPENLSGRGEVSISIKDKLTGKVVKKYRDSNLIVKTGRQTIVQLLAGDTDKSIKFLAVGNGGAKVQDGISVPTPPKTDDVGLGNEVETIEISGYSLDLEAARPAVTFSANIDSADIDSDINELGLLFNDSQTMFAKKTFRTIPFDIDSNLSMDVDWKIIF